MQLWVSGNLMSTVLMHLLNYVTTFLCLIRNISNKYLFILNKNTAPLPENKHSNTFLDSFKPISYFPKYFIRCDIYIWIVLTSKYVSSILNNTGTILHKLFPINVTSRNSFLMWRTNRETIKEFYEGVLTTY